MGAGCSSSQNSVIKKNGPLGYPPANEGKGEKEGDGHAPVRAPFFAACAEDGSFLRPPEYAIGKDGNVRFKGVDEEVVPLSDDELRMVLLPAISRPEFASRQAVFDSLTDEHILRLVRGYANNEPETDKWKAVVQRKELHPHAASVAEGVERCIEWRKQPSPKMHPHRTAYDLLSKPLPKADEWYKLWPFYSCGVDKHGHVLFVERLGELHRAKLQDANVFNLEEIMLFRAQAHEAMQHRQLQESQERGQMLYKHVSVIDLQGVPLTNINQLVGIIKPVLKLAETQYPNTLYKMFITNSPFIFRSVWALIRGWIDPETALKINIQAGPQNSLEAFEAAGIGREAVPDWIGGTGRQSLVLDIVNDAIESGGSAQPPASRELQNRVRQILGLERLLGRSASSLDFAGMASAAGCATASDERDGGSRGRLRGRKWWSGVRRLATLTLFLLAVVALTLSFNFGDACLGCTGELPDKAAQAASLWATFVTKSSKSGWDGGEVMGVEVGGGEGGDL